MGILLYQILDWRKYCRGLYPIQAADNVWLTTKFVYAAWLKQLSSLEEERQVFMGTVQFYSTAIMNQYFCETNLTTNYLLTTTVYAWIISLATACMNNLNSIYSI